MYCIWGNKIMFKLKPKHSQERRPFIIQT